MTIQVYGRFDGQWSHSQVSRGLVRGLVAHDVPLRIFNVASSAIIGGPGVVLYEDLDDLEGKLTVGHNAEADVGFYIGGYPPFAGKWLGRHGIKVALFITESESVPATWALQANECDLVIFPSVWARRAYMASLDHYTWRGRSMVVHHGLHDVYARSNLRQPHRDRLERPTVYGHVCGAASFPERKGTPQLVEAFEEVFKPGEAILKIRTPNVISARDWAREGLVELEWSDVGSQLSQEEMRDWYKGLDFLVQPSRAEAFGICPLEARATGRPVILTNATGHMEHFCPGSDIEVVTGQPTSISVNGIPNGVAPSVSRKSIGDALEQTRRLRAPLQLAAFKRAKGYHRGWSWTSVTSTLAKVFHRLACSERTLDDKLGVL